MLETRSKIASDDSILSLIGDGIIGLKISVRSSRESAMSRSIAECGLIVIYKYVPIIIRSRFSEIRTPLGARDTLTISYDIRV